MINLCISQETIDQLKAHGKSTDYLEEQLYNRRYQHRYSHSEEINVFDEGNDDSLLREITPIEAHQIQFFGRVIDRKTLKSIKKAKPHLYARYRKELQEILS